MPNGQHTETYSKASQEFSGVMAEAQSISKRVVALKIIADNLLAKSEEETLVDKLKKKIKGK